MIQLPKVTVVTVAYNAEYNIEKTILNVLSQAYPDIEYVIIDGGSSDSTVSIIKKYENRIAYWVSEPDEGIYDAMNKAIGIASGEWIIFMNAGDVFASRTTVRSVFSECRDGVDVIYGDTYLREEDGSLELEKAGDLDDVMWKYNPFYHQSLFVRTKLMKIENFDTDFQIVADSKFIYSQFLQGKKFLRLNTPVSIYLSGGVSMVNEKATWRERLRMALEFGEKDEEEIFAFYNKFLKG